MMWITYRDKKLHPDDIEGIRQFAMMNRDRRKLQWLLRLNPFSV
jgi:hypothetical protein